MIITVVVVPQCTLLEPGPFLGSEVVGGGGGVGEGVFY